MRVLLVDNYDSFTYNLVQYLCELGAELVVRRNDEVTAEEIERELRPEKIVISPGPGTPDGAGVTLEVVEKFAGRVPLLGVCLGHQAIGEAFGGTLINLDTVFHGVATDCQLSTDNQLFKGLPENIKVGRYHSWIVSDKNFPDELEITAKDNNGYIMALQHKKYDVQGVQFHPESILTPDGEIIMRNWLDV